jgi:hypothetical protein
MTGRPLPRAWALLAAALSATTLSLPARAQSADKAAAEVLFEQARALADKGNYREACPRFAESLRLDAGIGTMLWLADCYENNGQTASAWAEFKEAAGAAEMQHDGREKVARERAAKLEARLSRLTITVAQEAAIPGLEVRRDGLVISKVMWGIDVPIDPGDHQIRATAPGRKTWLSTVRVLAPGTASTLTIPVLEAAQREAPAAASSAPAGPERGAATGAGDGQRTIGLIVAGLGVVGVGIGTAFGLSASSTYDASNNGHCAGNQCDQTGLDDRSSASTKAAISTVAFGVGGAAIVGGLVLYLVAPRASSVSVAPVMGPGRLVGLALSSALP